jgi:hypothetical protein
MKNRQGRPDLRTRGASDLPFRGVRWGTEPPTPCKGKVDVQFRGTSCGFGVRVRPSGHLGVPLRCYARCYAKGVRSADDPVEAPAIGNALQLVFASILEPEPGAGDEVFDRLRHQDLRGACLRGHAGADRDGEARDPVLERLALSCVDTSTDLDPEGPDLIRDLPSTADRACRSFEGGVEAVVSRSVPSHRRKESREIAL